MIGRRALFPAVPASLSLFLSGCLSDPAAPDLKAPRAKWEQNKPALYAYTVQHTCYCLGGPVHVVAGRDSVLVARMEGDFPAAVLAGMPSAQDYAIDSLFDEVDKQLGRRHADRNLAFDPIYGFPSDVYIDFEKQVADEEYGLMISDFRPVNAYPQTVGDGVVTMTVKPYLALCGFFQPGSYGCPVISINGGPFAKSVSGINGLAFEWGKEKTLQVKVKNAPPGWQDVPPFEYTLIRETASVPVDSARFAILVGPRDMIQSETDLAGGGMLKIMGYKEITYTGAFPLDT